jgi:hypothetical protein
MSMTITKRLSVDNYDRPEKTITETIQNKKDIEEQLVNFEEVTDEELCYVNVNTQLKYLTYDKTKKKELFRFGGLLVKVNKDYILLAGKEGMRFSVQRYTKNEKGGIIHTTRFFRKIKDSDILKQELTNTKLKTATMLNNQNEYIQKQDKEILDLKKKLEKLEKKTKK